MTLLSFAKFLSWYGDSGSARNSSMPRETCTAPATLPLCCTSGASRTSTTRVLPLAIMSRACAGVIRGTAALAASIICLTLVAMASSSFTSIQNPPRPVNRASAAIGSVLSRRDCLRCSGSYTTQAAGRGGDHGRRSNVAEITPAFRNDWPACRYLVLRRACRRYQAAERLSAMVSRQHHDCRQSQSAVRRSRRNAQRLHQFGRPTRAQERRTLSRQDHLRHRLARIHGFRRLLRGRRSQGLGHHGEGLEKICIDRRLGFSALGGRRS